MLDKETKELREFYKECQGKHQCTPEEYWKNLEYKFANMFIEKIINKEFEVGKLNGKLTGDDYIKIKVNYNLPYECSRLETVYVNGIRKLEHNVVARPKNFLSNVQKIIKDKFGLSEIHLFSDFKNVMAGQYGILPDSFFAPHEEYSKTLWTLNFRV